MKGHKLFYMLGVAMGICGMLMFLGAGIQSANIAHDKMVLVVGVAVFDWVLAVVFFFIAEQLEKKEPALQEGGNDGSQN